MGPYSMRLPATHPAWTPWSRRRKRGVAARAVQLSLEFPTDPPSFFEVVIFSLAHVGQSFTHDQPFLGPIRLGGAPTPWQTQGFATRPGFPDLREPAALRTRN